MRSETVQRLLARWKCARKGHSLQWVRNVYGDSINFISNGNRSEWRCECCGTFQFRPELMPEP